MFKHSSYQLVPTCWSHSLITTLIWKAAVSINKQLRLIHFLIGVVITGFSNKHSLVRLSLSWQSIYVISSLIAFDFHFLREINVFLLVRVYLVFTTESADKLFLEERISQGISLHVFRLHNQWCAYIYATLFLAKATAIFVMFSPRVLLQLSKKNPQNTTTKEAKFCNFVRRYF